MKKEEEDKAARNCTDEISKEVYANGFYASIQEEDLTKAFKRGASWRIDSVWHDATEQPTRDEPILKKCYLNKRGRYEVSHNDSTRTDFSWKYLAFADGLLEWAYIEDLRPNK